MPLEAARVSCAFGVHPVSADTRRNAPVCLHGLTIQDKVYGAKLALEMHGNENEAARSLGLDLMAFRKLLVGKKYPLSITMLHGLHKSGELV
ncbi:hypothetical protein SAMN04515647_3697 [Cohaesibacter sp. ES.047]|uniref:hypothetical protein n=1 Tax=Cohaesibacter sp. ES.047 TaxID=1798205 RepID=UPI000BB6F547|nr:hypothetical protein [Cohaesibacter sp. ES.047]SNY93402.1 hypothetical protein SAMN04515647_3697 [Cohaesibacter sp. ES.047]